jgi:hypothetical protein
MTRFELLPEVQIVVAMARQFINEDCVATGVTLYKSPQLLVCIRSSSPFRGVRVFRG